MKKYLIIVLLFITSYCFGQYGGESTHKLKLIPTIGTGLKLATFDSYGVLRYYNLKTITLSGTTPIWDVTQSLNAVITLTGNTTLTMNNLVDGLTGNLRVINTSTLYTLTINTNYPNEIFKVIRLNTNQLRVSGNSKRDGFSWLYINGIVEWTGANDCH